MYLKIFFILSLLIMQLSALHSQTVLSLNPLFTEQEAFLFPQAESSWALDENDTVVIKKTGDNFYLLKYGKANNPSQYEAVFIHVGNTTFLDLVPKIPDTIGSNEYRMQMQFLHSFLKIKIENDTLWATEYPCHGCSRNARKPPVPYPRLPWRCPTCGRRWQTDMAGCFQMSLPYVSSYCTG